MKAALPGKHPWKVMVSPLDLLAYHKRLNTESLPTRLTVTLSFWWGGNNYKYFKYDHVKRKDARHQVLTF